MLTMQAAPGDSGAFQQDKTAGSGVANNPYDYNNSADLASSASKESTYAGQQPVYDAAGNSFQNGQWTMAKAASGAGGSTGAPGQGNANVGGTWDRFGVDPSGNIGTNSQGWDAAQAAGADGRDANGLPTYYQNVTAETPGSGMGQQSINNPRFNQFLTQNSTNTLSSFLKSLGFDNTISDSNFGGAGAPSDPQHNININGNIMNAGLIQQRLNNNKNPDGSFNIDYFKKQMQDEINSNGIGGSTQVTDAGGNPGYGMGGTVALTNNGINYDNGQMGGYAANRGGNATQAQQQQTNPNAGQNFGASLGQGGQQGGQQGQWPSASISMQPQGGGGLAGAGMGGSGMAGAAWPRYAMGGMGGGMYPNRGAGFQGMQRPPALGAGYGGFGNGMQNSQYYPQSEPNMRPGMQSNFRNAGAAPQGQQGMQQLLQMLMGGGQGGQMGGGQGMGGLLQMLLGVGGGGQQNASQNGQQVGI